MTDKEIFPDLNHCSVGIIGLVCGLPLALEIAKKRSRLIFTQQFKNIIGYDLNPDRIQELNDGLTTREIAQEDLQNNSFLKIHK